MYRVTTAIGVVVVIAEGVSLSRGLGKLLLRRAIARVAAGVGLVIAIYQAPSKAEG